jgi:hypothetical protein
VTDGWWIRLDTGSSVRITEHELDIRNPEIARRLGVPDAIFKQFVDFTPVKDRIRFLRWLLSVVPIARVRGHGVWATVEYDADDNAPAFKAIHRWGKKVCGPCLMLCFVNLKTGARVQSPWLLFDEAMRKKIQVSSVPVEVTTI